MLKIVVVDWRLIQVGFGKEMLSRFFDELREVLEIDNLECGWVESALRRPKQVGQYPPTRQKTCPGVSLYQEDVRLLVDADWSRCLWTGVGSGSLHSRVSAVKGKATEGRHTRRK